MPFKKRDKPVRYGAHSTPGLSEYQLAKWDERLAQIFDLRKWHQPEPTETQKFITHMRSKLHA